VTRGQETEIRRQGDEKGGKTIFAALVFGHRGQNDFREKDREKNSVPWSAPAGSGFCRLVGFRLLASNFWLLTSGF